MQEACRRPYYRMKLMHPRRQTPKNTSWTAGNNQAKVVIIEEVAKALSFRKRELRLDNALRCIADAVGSRSTWHWLRHAHWRDLPASITCKAAELQELC